MDILHSIKMWWTGPPYVADNDPAVLERREIAARTEHLVRRFETERHAATGMTLADMAANRRRQERERAWMS